MRSRQSALARKLYVDEPMAAVTHRVRKRKKGWWRLAAVGTGALALVTLTVMFYLGLCTRIVEKQYALDRVEGFLPPLREENANLKIQVLALGEPNRIERLARAELQLEVPMSRIMIVEDREEPPPAEYAWKGNLQKIASP